MISMFHGFSTSDPSTLLVSCPALLFYLLTFQGSIDDAACNRVARLFNEPAGKAYLQSMGIPSEVVLFFAYLRLLVSLWLKLVAQLCLFGLSGIANILGCIKMAHHFEFNEDDVLVTVATDGMELYQVPKFMNCNIDPRCSQD